jgi:hypothetical protein
MDYETNYDRAMSELSTSRIRKLIEAYPNADRIANFKQIAKNISKFFTENHLLTGNAMRKLVQASKYGDYSKSQIVLPISSTLYENGEVKEEQIEDQFIQNFS